MASVRVRIEKTRRECTAGSALRRAPCLLTCMRFCRVAPRDFTVGQLVQVTRTDCSWTYGKIMEYDGVGDNYTVRSAPRLVAFFSTRALVLALLLAFPLLVRAPQPLSAAAVFVCF